MIQGILFDMDGVLFDTERLHVTVRQQAAADMGFPMPPGLAESLGGVNDEEYVRRIEEATRPGLDRQAFVARVHQGILSHVEQHGVPKKPGLDELLHYLGERGRSVAVASSSPLVLIRRLLELAGIAGNVDAVVGGDMVDASKPAPDIFVAAARALGLPPGQCAAVEDSYNGVLSASAAGCFTLMVPDLLQPDEALLPHCDAVLERLDCLIPLLESGGLQRLEEQPE